MAKHNPYKGPRGVALLQSASTTAAEAEQQASQAPDWAEILNKPSEFPAEAHTHPVSDLDDTPIEVTGTRDDPESALAMLLTKLEELGIITDSTTAT